MNKKNIYLIIVLLVCVSILEISAGAYYFLQYPNIQTSQKKYIDFYVPKNSTWQSVKDSLKSNNLIKSEKSFDFALKLIGKNKQVICGKYVLEPNISNRAFINRIAYGMSHHVTMELKMTRYTEWVARNLSRQMEVDSASLANYLLSDSLLLRYNLNKDNSLALFIRFSKEMSWCASPAEIVAEITKEYDNFWNPERRALASKTGLTIPQIHILASIIEEETNEHEDKRMVAGVYINRIRKGMPLQSCPTVRFAWADFTIDRVLKTHLEIESPYNTYKNASLPPGPIRIPSEKSIDAVLNYVHHRYIYFCAKSDFSGTHEYAVTFQEHSRNARKYQKELNKRGIK